MPGSGRKKGRDFNATRGPGASRKGENRVDLAATRKLSRSRIAGADRATTKNFVMLKRQYEAQLEALARENDELLDKYAALDGEIQRRTELMQTLVAEGKAEFERGKGLFRAVVAAVMRYGDSTRDPMTGRMMSATLDLSADVPPDEVLARTHLDISADGHVTLTVKEADPNA